MASEHSNAKLRVGLLSTGRQDWGVLRSTAARLAADDAFDLRVLLGGMALAERFGRIDRLVEQEGFPIHERLDFVGPEEEPTYRQAGRAFDLVGAALERQRLDLLVLVGDRFETLVAATVATLVGTPIAHLHGGEETEGAIDDAFRHAITKLADVHLAAHPSYAARIVAMGEAPESVHVVGAPGLDNLRRADLADRAELEAFLGAKLEGPVVVVTVHPETRAADPSSVVDGVLAAMDAVPATYVVTLPNADPGGAAIRDRLTAWVAKGARRVAVDALGERRYWGLLRQADAMLGNSSSGVIEAPALALPVVNVGDRQKGRLRSPSILDVGAEPAAVTAALRRAIDPAFRASLEGTRGPFGDGHAAEAIAAVLRAWAGARS